MLKKCAGNFLFGQNRKFEANVENFTIIGKLSTR